MILSRTFIFTSALFIAAFLFAFVTVTPAHAQCPAPAEQGGISIQHAACMPAGPGRCSGSPKKPGKDLCVCKISGTQGGSVTGMCKAGCCMYVSSTSAGDAIKQAGGGLLGQLGQQLFSKLLEQLMGGGGGGGESGGQPSHFAFGNTPEGEKLLELDPNFGEQDDSTGFNLAFGTDEENIDTTPQLSVSEEPVVEETPVVGGEQQPVEPEGDTVTSTYESVEEEGATRELAPGQIVADVPGDGSDFDDDFFGTSLDSTEDISSGSGLSLNDLEAEGLFQASRLGEGRGGSQAGSLNVPYESLTQAEIRTLQDYHSSAVAVSGKLAPNGETLIDEEEEQDDGALLRFVKFMFSLFGFGPPATN